MKLLKKPDTFLRAPTQEVELPLGDENKIIIKNMINMMYQNNGIGLAANQVGYNRRIFVMDVSNERDNPQVFINPVIAAKNNIKMKDVEGCLSCPAEEVKVSRSISVNLEWFCEHGEKQHKTFYYLPCVVVQHEMDHLNGKLITDYKPILKREKR
jgi:peptide deformylase|tara:strand:+ start:151 stop:615 length:465 start_codon:yes stop_codon:yes gene_type:complete